VLTWNGTAWVNAAIPTKSLDDLTDVVITTPVANNLLVHNGTNFVNQAGSSSLVGLNNVQNFGIANQQEAETGTESEKYMTPERTKQAIEALSSSAETFSLTVQTTDWIEQTSGDFAGNYLAVMTLSGLLDTDNPIVDLDFTGQTNLTANALIAEFQKIFGYQATDDDELTLYASDELNKEITFHITVVR
jgi:hypothetical protein